MLWPLNGNKEVFLWNNIMLASFVDFLLNVLVCSHDNRRGETSY